MNMGRLRTKDLTILSMLVALNVVMAELFKFPIIPKVLELSFGFVPIAVAGMLFGPLPAMAVAAAADIIGALIFSSGDFYLGYTLTALMTGLFYGLMLYKQDVRLSRAAMAQALVSLVCFAGLNTLWAYQLGYARTSQYIVTRLTVNLVAYPVYVLVLVLILRYRRTLETAIR